MQKLMNWVGPAAVLFLAWWIASTDQFLLVLTVFFSPPVGFFLFFLSHRAAKKDDQAGAKLLLQLGLGCLLLAASCYTIAHLDETYSWGILPPDRPKG